METGISVEKNTKSLLRVLLFILSAFTGALLFSETTSPLFSDWGYDSAMFQTIGKYWAEGFLPYVDLFDHKGPIIFFINAVGYAIRGRTGVFLLQILFLAAAEAAAYRLLRIKKAERVSLLLSLLLPLVLAANWQEGNTTEEYILPFLLFSYYRMYKWSVSFAAGEYTHAPFHAAIYGAAFAFALLTRVTNAIGVCIGVLFISISLTVKKEWKNLFQNALGFFLGAAVLIVPFCLYYYLHGALYEMWYGSLLFNMDYYSASGLAKTESIVQLLVRIRMYLPGWCLVAVSFFGLFFRRSSRFSSAFWLSVSLPTTLFLYTMNDYAHYGICLLPFFYVAVNELCGSGFGFGREKLVRFLSVSMIMLVLFSSGLKIYRNRTQQLPMEAYERYIDDYTPLTELIDESGRESFIAFDCPRRFYLDTNLRPCFRYFTLQQWMSVNSAVFARNIHDEFLKSRIEWVIAFRLYDEAEQPSVIADILEEKYTLEATTENGVYSLYHLK